MDTWIGFSSTNIHIYIYTMFVCTMFVCIYIYIHHVAISKTIICNVTNGGFSNVGVGCLSEYRPG